MSSPVEYAAFGDRQETWAPCGTCGGVARCGLKCCGQRVMFPGEQHPRMPAPQTAADPGSDPDGERIRAERIEASHALTQQRLRAATSTALAEARQSGSYSPHAALAILAAKR